MHLENELSNKIAKISLNHFNQLPKTGKPTTQEWTVLATIVQENSENNILDIVACGTGSKCIGKNSMSKNGTILNDSHAEIICRRAFLLYLYSELEKAFKHQTSIFDQLGNKCSLKNTVRFHFFSTHVPCGDAAIFLKENNDDEFDGKCVAQESTKRSVDALEEVTDSDCKRFKRDGKKAKVEDVHRTGGKCLPKSEVQDPQLQGPEYHVLGAVRTKPGRGDPTLSLSCSDKLAKWTFLGIQGALLSLIIDKPIYLHSFIIANGTPYNSEALSRALHGRFQEINLPNPYKQSAFIFGYSETEFKYAKTEGRRPCPSSIIWSKTSYQYFEVAVEGKKLGTTKKTVNTKKSRLVVCKMELFRTFINLVKEFVPDIFGDHYEINKITYKEAKMKADDYQIAWLHVKDACFKIWTEKDVNLLQFYLD